MQQYLNAKIEVTETTQHFSHLDSYTSYAVATTDTTITDLRVAVQAAGFRTLRVWLPDTVGTMDLRSDRVNAHIEKNQAGEWRIARLNVG